MAQGSQLGQNPYEVELATQQYTTNLQLLLQQERSKLRGYLKTGNHVGKGASPVQYIGALEFKAPQGRFQPVAPQEPNYTRRWVFPQDRSLAVLVDSFDELRTTIDPRAGINAAVVAAANRVYDDISIQSAFANATTGVDGTNYTTETFVTGNYQVAATFGGGGSNTGMIYQKLVEADRIFRHWENDMDMVRKCVILGSQQIADLQNQVEVVSTEFRTATMGEDGKLRSFMGYDIIHSERLQYTSSNLRNVIAFIDDGLYMGMWKDIETTISQRNDLEGHPWQAYSMLTCGATRLQPGKVIQIQCYDTTGSDITF
jgi:hypothetical protein